MYVYMYMHTQSHTLGRRDLGTRAQQLPRMWESQRLRAVVFPFACSFHFVHACFLFSKIICIASLKSGKVFRNIFSEVKKLFDQYFWYLHFKCPIKWLHIIQILRRIEIIFLGNKPYSLNESYDPPFNSTQACPSVNSSKRWAGSFKQTTV